MTPLSRYCRYVSVLGGTFSVGLFIGIAQAEETSVQDIQISGGILCPFEHVVGQAAGFFKIQNNGTNDQLLQGISSPLCEQVRANYSNQEIVGNLDDKHDIFHSLVIPQHETMAFPKMGYHIFCRGMKKQLASGENVPFTFHFMGNKIVTAFFRMKDQTSSIGTGTGTGTGKNAN